MSTAKFDINRHQVPCSHIREYPRALSTEDQTQLFLSVKQYVPKNNPRPQPGDITIVASQANAFPKELYEPLWDDLLNYSERLTSQGKSSFRIREVWMADVAHQGGSYILNEENLGNDPGWFDHSRDILHMINQFRMQPPIFGVGHSMGGAQLTNIALFHPRLFSGLILLDPVIQPRTTEVIKDSMRPNLAALSTFRRDLWPSRDAAREGFGKSPFYQSWDKRVFDRWIESGLRDCPTLLYPDEKAPKVTLTTPVGQEVYQFSRPNFQNYGAAQAGKVNRKTHADLDPDKPNQHPFYRWEPNRTFARLEEIRPSVLYVSGEISDVSHIIPGLDETRLRRTGTGIGGSGGEAEGRVKLVELKGVGHLVVMEEKGLRETVVEAGKWLGLEVGRWKDERQELQSEWFSVGDAKKKQEINEEWKRHMGGPPKRVKKEGKL